MDRIHFAACFRAVTCMYAYMYNGSAFWFSGGTAYVYLAFARAPVMPGDWSYEQTRSLVGVWSQTNVQGERDGVTRNPVVFERIA